MSSIIIARLLGPLLLVSAAAIIVNRKGIQKVVQNEIKNPSVIYTDGIMMLLGGLAIVEFHNIWTATWRTIITVLGWLMVVGGGARMLAPDQVGAMARRSARSEAALAIGAAISAVLGFVLTMQAFQTTP
ncbi:MAG: hypothetical protein U0441_17270 [Polyangiaceae bacterium]